MITITRYHDFSAGHRVHGHESKCAHLHGHNYRVHFTCTAKELDKVGRVIDFEVVKQKLCEWLEDAWDHKFLIWDKDDSPIGSLLREQVGWTSTGIREVPFNPTAENIARYLVEEVGPTVLLNTGVILISCTVDETRKCSASYTIGGYPY